MDNFWHLYYRVFDPARRIGRGTFNVIMGLAFLPVTAFQFYGFMKFGQELAGNWMNPTYLKGLNSAPPAPTFELGGAFYLLTMAAIAPVFVARLRAVGWRPHWVWLVYAPIAFTLIKELLGITLPWIITVPVGLTGGVMVLRLCMKKSIVIEKAAPSMPPSSTPSDT